MDAQLKAKWVEALRSGEYEQTNGGLCLDGRYCCLGVLAKASGRGKWITNDGSYHWFSMDGDDPKGRSQLTLPTSFREFAGLSREEQKICWKMNDLDGKTFPEIADYIEANL